MRIVGQAQLADMFSVSEVTIDQWQTAGMPVLVRGAAPRPNEYDSRACIDWLVSREVGKVSEETPRDRLFRLQAEKLELELARDRGQMVAADEIEPLMRAAVVSAREMLMQQPPKIAMLAEGRPRAEIETIVRDAIEEAMRRAADWQPKGDDE